MMKRASFLIRRSHGAHTPRHASIISPFMEHSIFVSPHCSQRAVFSTHPSLSEALQSIRQQKTNNSHAFVTETDQELEFDKMIQLHTELLGEKHNNRKWIRQLVDISEQAHNLLCQIEPQLSFRNLQVTADSMKEDKNLTHRCNALLQSWADTIVAAATVHAQSAVPGLPQRAQHLLERMEASSRTQPNAQSYQAVIASWAFSMEHLRGTRAEPVFSRMLPHPTPEAYRLVLRAWAWSRERRSAFHATGHLMKMLRILEKDSDMEPQLDDYQVVLEAWTTAEDKMAPRKAHSLLRLWEGVVAKNLTEIQPDLASFRSVLVTASRRPTMEEMGALVDDVLIKMNDRYIIPDQICYGAAIRTWKNCAINCESSKEQREWAASRCLELFEEMKRAHQRVTSFSIQLITTNANDAMEAFAENGRIDDTEKVLSDMEHNLVYGNAGPFPDATSYALAIQSWCRSTDVNNVSKANHIVNRFVQSLVTHGPSHIQGDGTQVFDAFIRVCASNKNPDTNARSVVFREALAAVELMKSRKFGKASPIIYSSLLCACGKLITDKTEQDHLLERVFRLCCADGMVDDIVLRNLKNIASSDLYTKLVINESELVDGIRLVPEFWSVNALGGRVVTADGRKTTPLSVEGRLTVTRAMQEFRMRTIRRHRNRSLLQGGRLKHEQRTSTSSFTIE